MSNRLIIQAFLAVALLLGGCPTFTAGESVSPPNPAEVRASMGKQQGKQQAKTAEKAGQPKPVPAPRPTGMREAAAKGETATASHILVSYKGSARAKPEVTRGKDEARARAEEALKKAKGGADFAGLAKEYSDGPSGPRGGKLGTFPRGRMVPAFDTAVFGMPAGQVAAELVETPFGFHVIYREQ